ncbi:MAG: DUF1684 domain-containing protein [Cyclobacteriaceae bacterium]|nr:DUF1684 domain-containing protein [Cyclobacteriaceae bacterium]
MFKNSFFVCLTVLLVSIIYGCFPTNDRSYFTSIAEWHQLRIDSLKGETGFLNLAGLFWLNQGENTFGADSTNDFNFTEVSSPNLGSFLLRDSLVYLIPRASILIDGKEVMDTTLVFNNEEALIMEYKSLHWLVIKRGGNIGVRLRDYNHPLLQSFDSINYFKTNLAWRLRATWVKYAQPKIISFTNVLNMTIEYPIYGAFKFTVKGEEYQLEPLGKPGPDGYFLMFYDKTSGNYSYGSGRYLYIEEPDETGFSFIDFNKAFNPPCAFTEFATCLFPHKENRLPIFVNAGEKFSRH